MSDCPTCVRAHLCNYEHKPCDCFDFRKYKEADGIEHCTKCNGDGYAPYPLVCQSCKGTGWVRGQLVDLSERHPS